MGAENETHPTVVLPSLRFPGFGDSAWTSVPMSRLYSFMRNNALARDKLNYDAGRVKNIHYGDIHTKFPALLDTSKERVPFINDTEQIPDDNSDDYCLEGDVIFADASEDTNDVGKSMEILRLNGERLLSGQHTILARRKDKSLIVGFGGHLFRSAHIRQQIEKEAQGTKVYAISPTRLRNIAIAYPEDHREQRKIADCLTSLDEVIGAQSRQVAALTAYKRGLMQQLFPREGETVPRLRFPEFRDTGEWETRTLGDEGMFLSSLTGKTAIDFDTGEAFFIPYMNVFSNTFTDVRDLRPVNVLAHESQNSVMPGDIFFTVSSETPEDAGMSSVLLEPIERCYLNSFCALFRFHPGRRPHMPFIGYLLRSAGPRAHVSRGAQGATRYNISKGTFRSLPLMLPRPAEQQRVAACLSALEARLAASHDKLAALRDHKKGLMQQLFPRAEQG